MNAGDGIFLVFEDGSFLCLMYYLLELFPKLLKKSGMFDHFIKILLNERWGFNGRTPNLAKIKLVMSVHGIHQPSLNI